MLTRVTKSTFYFTTRVVSFPNVGIPQGLLVPLTPWFRFGKLGSPWFVGTLGPPWFQIGKLNWCQNQPRCYYWCRVEMNIRENSANSNKDRKNWKKSKMWPGLNKSPKSKGKICISPKKKKEKGNKSPKRKGKIKVQRNRKIEVEREKGK